MKLRIFVFLLLTSALLAGCGAKAFAAPVPPATQTATLLSSTGTATVTPTFTASPTPTVTWVAQGPGAIKVPILMYHHIQDLPSDASVLIHTWTVAQHNFDAQMALLAQRGFHAITMAQLVGQLKGGKSLPAKPIVVSFDDGWAEQYTVAFAVLKKYRLSGTFFVYTRPLDHAQFMTWLQLQEMSAAGMDIQPHTLTHPHLRALAPDEAMKEIADSKSILETRLGKPMIAFAYPFGEYNAAVIDLLKRAGFEAAVTLDPGYRQRADELFTLHRIRVSYNDTLDDFAKRLPQ